MNIELLRKQDDTLCRVVVDHFKNDTTFKQLAQKETAMLMKRDDDDEEKLAQGLQISIKKGVIPAKIEVEPVSKIDVENLTCEQTVDIILKSMNLPSGSGCLLVMQGRSGTGKGTTVERLKQVLPKAVSWSNGNVFRSLTLLAVTWCQQQGIPFTKDILTAELVAKLMQFLKFGKFEGKYDIQIEGLGIKALVSQIASTQLMDPRVATNVPIVAQETQGEVINFAANAIALLRAEGHSVLLEGRAQTVNYIRSPHRFELIMGQPQVLGERRLAQRMFAAALQLLKQKYPSEVQMGQAKSDEVSQALTTALQKIAQS